MNAVERAERLLKEHMGLVPPWDRPYAKRALEWALNNVWEIEAFRAQGLELIPDPARRELIVRHIGEKNGHDPEDYNFNVWLANECIGTQTPARHILLRCTDCHRLRTHRKFESSVCKCGGMRLTSAIPTDLNTRMAMKALVMGR